MGVIGYILKQYFSFGSAVYSCIRHGIRLPFPSNFPINKSKIAVSFLNDVKKVYDDRLRILSV